MSLETVRFRPSLAASRFYKLVFGTKTRSGLLGDWCNADISDDPASQFTMAKQASDLVGHDVSCRLVHGILAPIFSREIRRVPLEYVCWRLAANVEFIAAGNDLPTWQGYLGEPTHAPLQVAHVKFGWSVGKQRIPGVVITFKIIDGLLCPMRFSRWFPNKFLYKLAKELGILKYRAKAKYKGIPTQLQGMRMVATLVDSKYEQGAITFDRFVCGQFSHHNVSLMRWRSEPCPAGYSWPCHTCSLGEDDCPAKEETYSRACRPTTLVSILCMVCGEATNHDGGECVRCRRRHPGVVSATMTSNDKSAS